MFKRIKENVVSRISPTGQHLAGLRADLHSRLGFFRHHRSVSEQHMLTEDFRLVLTAWGIDDAAAVPGIVRELRLRFLILAMPLLAGLIAALLLQSFVSILALAVVTPPCLLGIVTTAWRISILKNRRFLPLSRWLLSFVCFFRKRP